MSIWIFSLKNRLIPRTRGRARTRAARDLLKTILAVFELETNAAFQSDKCILFYTFLLYIWLLTELDPRDEDHRFRPLMFLSSCRVWQGLQVPDSRLKKPLCPGVFVYAGDDMWGHSQPDAASSVILWDIFCTQIMDQHLKEGGIKKNWTELEVVPVFKLGFQWYPTQIPLQRYRCLISIVTKFSLNWCLKQPNLNGKCKKSAVHSCHEDQDRDAWRFDNYSCLMSTSTSTVKCIPTFIADFTYQVSRPAIAELFSSSLWKPSIRITYYYWVLSVHTT